MTETWILLALAALNVVLLLWLLLRPAAPSDHSPLLASNARIARDLRPEIGESSRGARQESAQAFATFQRALLHQGAESTRTQNAQIDAFAQQLAVVGLGLSARQQPDHQHELDDRERGQREKNRFRQVQGGSLRPVFLCWRPERA